MKSMLADQMNNMFAEGGVMQEGGTVDPVSGNEVPVGAMQEEVRDDIDAKLSEGEFVFPADVVRFYGLEKLMMMRDKAKKGLQRMNDIGQMGNAEEVPDGEALFGDEEMDDDMFSSEIDSIMAEEG
jgi:Arc/MetJ-type ribon-helix-helix transcriptional regulator